MSLNQKANNFYRRKDWWGFLEVVSPLQKTILVATGRRLVSAESLSRQIFTSVNTISCQLSKLKNSGVLKQVERGKYRIKDSELADYCARQQLREIISLDKEEVLNRVSTEIYGLAVGLFEPLEHLGVVRGNGHHIAQKLSEIAVERVKKDWSKVDKIK